MPYGEPSSPVSAYNLRFTDATTWTMAVNIQYDFSGMTPPDVAVTDEFMQRITDTLVAGGLVFAGGGRTDSIQVAVTPTPPA